MSITILQTALVIQKEHLDKFFQPSNPKVWEMRGTRTNIRGWVGLIEAGSGLVVGAAWLADSLGEVDEKSILENADKHQVADVSRLRKWKFPWVFKRAYRFNKPFSYEHPRGAVIWVNISRLRIGILED